MVQQREGRVAQFMKGDNSVALPKIISPVKIGGHAIEDKMETKNHLHDIFDNID